MFLPYLGRERELSAEIERARSLEGDHAPAERTLLLYMLRHGDTRGNEFRSQFARVAAAYGPGSLESRLFQRLDDPDAARTELRKAFADPVEGVRSLRSILQFADGLGDRELAIAALRKSVTQPPWRTPYQLGYLLWYPYRTQLRRDVRFKELVREIGLVAYWRESGQWGDYCRPSGASDFECE